MAGHPHRSGASAALGGVPTATPPVELDTTEVLPVARVPRSRLTFALAVTIAALPVLVLDNLPATADQNEPVEVAAVSASVEAPRTTAARTPATQAPTTTVAPATIEETTTTVAPAPTTTAAPVRARSAPAPTPTTAPPTTQPAPPPAPSSYGDPNDPASWDRMAQCEADGNWAANTGNGYYGGLQFSLSTWQTYGGSGYPHEASKADQIVVGKRLQAARGWAAWPGCARELGYT
jgi:resuscitation-promoting factor RpfB